LPYQVPCERVNMTKRKIAIISNARVIGGGEHYLSTIIPELISEFEVTVFAPKTVRQLLQGVVETKHFMPFPNRIERIIPRHHKLKKLYYRLYFWHLRNLKKYDIVDLQWFEGAVIEGISHPSLALTLHTAFVIPRQYDAYVRTVSQRLTRIICVSQRAKSDLINRGVPADLCSVVPNGITAMTSFNAKRGLTHRVFWVGRVEEADKNPLLFVKIAQRAQELSLPYAFDMVGDGSYLPYLRSYADKQAITNLTFHGPVAASVLQEDLYPQADIVCLTSTSESAPFVVLEAMAAGAVVVATKVGGLPELLPSKAEGVLIDSFEPNDFVEVLRELYDTPDRIGAIRRSARKRYEALYTTTAMGTRTRSVLNDMQAEKSILIGVEGGPLLFGNRSGVGQYALRLTEASASLNPALRFEVIKHLLPFTKFQPSIPAGTKLHFRLVRWFPPAVFFQAFKRLGTFIPYDLIALRKYDVFLFYNFVAFPIRKRTKVAAYIHDLSFIYHKQYVSPKNQRYLERFVPKTIKRADQILTISQNSKQEIMDYYHVPEKKITVINPAIDHAEYRPRSKADVEHIKKKYDIKKPYIFSLCTLEPRKNLLSILEAFDSLPEALKQRYALVLGGGKGWLDGELLARYDELAKRYDIIKTGYVADEDLPALYSGADLFVFVPFYEGFGMPLLEAMACGTPVISADNSSLPEVLGDAGIMVSAEDSAALAREMESVLTSQKLAAKLRQKGIDQAANFSWEKSAQQLVRLVRDMAA
jgi:glycosyltransferase involved in cell wall biosynthesis